MILATMSIDEFVARFGGVYEHSTWVAEQTYPALAKNPKTSTAAELAKHMAEAMNAASQTRKLALIRAHPDLAGKAAIGGQLTQESTFEQKGAGLDQCSPSEFAKFTRLNSAYTDKFKFPFIIAVKGHTRRSILQAFEDRLQNSPEYEFAEALRQINRIAAFRIEEIFK